MNLWTLRISLLSVATGIRSLSTVDLFRQVFFHEDQETVPKGSPAWAAAPPRNCELAAEKNASQLAGSAPFMAPVTGTFIKGCSGKSLDVILPCEAPRDAPGMVDPQMPWILRDMLGSFSLNLACLEDLYRAPKRLQKNLLAKYVHSGSVMILTSGTYSMGLDVAETQLKHLTLIHLGDLSSNWAHEYRRWRFVFRTFWTDDANSSYQKLMAEERLAYLPLGPTPQLLWHGQQHLQNASKRPLKIYFGGSGQRRQSRLDLARKLLGKDLVIETGEKNPSGGYDQHYLEQLYDSAMCLQVPGLSIESHRLYESLEAGCIPVVVLAWSQKGDPLVKLQMHGEALPFLSVSRAEDLPQILQLSGVQLDMLQAQGQAWWTRSQQDFRTRVQAILQPPRPSHKWRGLELKWPTGCVLLFVSLAVATMIFCGTQGKQVPDPGYELSVEVVRLVLVVMIVTDHFWMGSLQLQREECCIWKLVVLSGFFAARADVWPLQRYFHHRFVGHQQRRLRWYVITLAVASVSVGHPDVLCFLGLHTWEVLWHPACAPHNQLHCPSYRWNAPLWPLPGLFLCWLLYPFISWTLQHLRLRSPVFVSMVLLLGSALCYWLSMVLLDWPFHPFQSFPPLLLAPFGFGVFTHEWLCTLKRNEALRQWRARLQMLLPLSLLLQQLIPGLPGGWNLPLLLPLFLPGERKKGLTLVTERGEALRSWVMKLGRASPTCYMLQLPVALLLMYVFEFMDCAGIAASQVKTGSLVSLYPQMSNASFLIYLVILWSLGLLSTYWPSRTPSDT